MGERWTALAFGPKQRNRVTLPLTCYLAGVDLFGSFLQDFRLIGVAAVVADAEATLTM